MLNKVKLPLFVDIQLFDEDDISEELLSIGDRHSIPSQRILRDSGELIAPCTIARTGVMLYRARDLGSLFADRDPMDVIKVMTTAEELFAADSLESYRSCPITLNHPRDAKGAQVDVDLTNNKALQKGMLEGMPFRDADDCLAGNIVVNDEDTITLVDDGYDQLSSGHKCRLIRVKGKDWDAEKTAIRANHIAIVQKGRAGNARIADEDNMEEILELDNNYSSESNSSSTLSVDSTNKTTVISETTTHTTDVTVLQAKYDELYTRYNALVVKYGTSEEALGDSKESIAALQVQLSDAASTISGLHTQLANEKSKNLSDAEIEIRVQKCATGRLKLLTQIAKLGDDFEELEIEGKKDVDIKRAVLGRLYDSDFSSKTDLYVDARFDAALEDSGEVTLSDALSYSMLNTKTEVNKGHVNQAEEAKKRRRERYNK
jgi:hypothetical protein